jgi:hypothetical protein
MPKTVVKKSKHLQRQHDPLSLVTRRPIGEFNKGTIQQRVIAEIIERLGPEKTFATSDGNYSKHISLERVLNEVKSELFGMQSTRNMPRWFNHYIWYDETMAETKAWNKYLTTIWGHRARNSRSWDCQDIECLRRIIDNKPWLYLDEIQEELLYERTKFFHESNV